IWWFASTAVPLIAGTFGPIANLLSVCAIVQTWKVAKNGNGRVKDPVWLITLNALSLVWAIVANAALLLNFSRRIRYTSAQIVSIAFWYLACIFLFTPIGLLHTSFFDKETEELSQSWYYGLLSGIVYFIISTLLLLNIVGSHWYRAYPPSFVTLSVSQRMLMLQTITFSFYLALVAGIYSGLEGWDFVDAVYWADYTLLTIGLGTDFPIETTAGRMLVMPLSAFGILLIGLIIGSVRGLLLERAKVKVLKRQLGKQRDEWHRYIAAKRKEWLKRKDKRAHLDPSVRRQARSRWNDLGGPEDGVDGPWMRREFYLMRHIEQTAEKVERYTVFGFSLCTLVFVWVGGAAIFWLSEHNLQHWTYPISLYFSYTSITTIGYGDFYPVSAAGRPFFVVWSLIAVPTVTVFISSMGNTVIKGFQDFTFWISKFTVLPEKSKDLLQDVEKGIRDEGRKRRSILENASRRNQDIDESVHPESDADSANIVEGEDQFKTVPINGEDLVARIKYAKIITKLSREIGKVSRDVENDPGKKYSWDQWMAWFRLLDGSLVAEESQQGQAEEPHLPSDDRSFQDGPMRLKEHDRTWFWLSDDGPLFSDSKESQWVLDKLTGRLEQLLSEGFGVHLANQYSDSSSTG
ncbi:voltage-gated potassium channel, partial [Coprinopsis marcescibilis]